MIIHVTREIGQVRVYKANGNETLIRKFFEQQDVEEMVIRKSIEDKYLSHERLEEQLSGMLKAVLLDEADIEVYVY
ncbi:MAG: hypothetical protein WC848_04840 [Parcubacteria group bacterium]|jgi:hypothetical protein